MTTYKPSRLFVTDEQKSFEPAIKNTPDLPVIDYSAVGQSAPKLLSGSGSTLPKADAIVITWASAEWAAMQHVFCDGGSAMSYSKRSESSWPDWNKYSKGLPSGGPSDWTFWGEWRLVEIGGSTVMLFKSNTHLDWPGQSYLTDMIKMLIADVTPSLILSIGTAGGAKVTDHIGTVRAVSAGTLYEQGVDPSKWPVYKNDWKAIDTVLNNSGFSKLLFPVPTVESDLESLCTQFNEYYGTACSLSDLDAGNLDYGDTTPQIDDETDESISLLTTPTFVVGTTAGAYQSYICIEMDDAIIGQVCNPAGVAFGFVRNISDPVQNASLSAEIQGNWGSAIYDSYGFYTSYNGALAAWAMLAGNSK